MSIYKVLLLATVVILPWTIAAEAQKEDAVKAEMKKLQGVWQVTKFIDHSEKPAPADEVKEITFEFKEDKVYQQKSKDFPAKLLGKYKLNLSKKPKWIDIESVEVMEGIYKLDGDELSLCIIAGNRSDQVPERPTEFKASKKRIHTLMVMKKVKK